MSNLSTKIADFRAIAARYADGKSDPNETETRRVLVEPVLQILGWNTLSLDEIKGEFAVNKDRVDYALFVDEKPRFLLEAKRLKENLANIVFISQAVNYGNTLNVPWCILTNGREWQLYCVHAELPMPEKLLYRADLISSTDAEILRLMALLARANQNTLAIREAWDDVQEERLKSRAKVVHHETLPDEELKLAVIRYEAVKKTRLANIENSSSSKTFIDDTGAEVHFSLSNPYKGSEKTVFVKLPEAKLFGRDFVIFCPTTKMAWAIPTQPLKTFMSKIPPSKGAGRVRWDPRVGLIEGRWKLWTDIKKYGALDVTDFYFEY